MIEKVYAHEAYVMSREQFTQGLQDTSSTAFSSLQNPQNFFLFILMSVGALAILATYLFIARSKVGQNFDHFLQKHNDLGMNFLRIAVGTGLIISSYSNRLFGPELLLSLSPLEPFLRIALLLIGFSYLLNKYVRITSCMGILIYALGYILYQSYILTYCNYLGIFLAFALFPQKSQEKIVYIRVFAGIALAYAALSIKLLHPQIFVDLLQSYHLTNLLPGDPSFATLGAGISELAIGMLLILGLAVRLGTLMVLVVMTLTLFVFQEVVWPHFILYGLAVSLFINNGGDYRLDRSQYLRLRTLKNSPKKPSR